MARERGPVPENQWIFRRLLTFGFTLFAAGFSVYVAIVFAKAGAVAALLTLTLAIIVQNACIQLIYLVAPSAEYLSRIAELVKAARGDNDAPSN